MGKWLKRAVERKEAKDREFSHIPTNNTIVVPAKSVESGIDFVDFLTKTERNYYFGLMEIMQSPKFGMSRETAEREAGRIITRNRQPLQVKQAAQDYRRHGYIKIFSTVLGKAVYLARDQITSRRVPDRDIPIFLESDIEAVKGLPPEEARILLEVRILLNGPITIENIRSPYPGTEHQRRLE